MANQEHLDNLKRGVQVWNEWRKEYPDIRPDLSTADLGEIDLREANLSGVEFNGAYLKGANLSGARLNEAYLMGANMRGANFREANLSGVNISRWSPHVPFLVSNSELTC